MRLLIGCVSVKSDWCSLGLCDTECLRTVFTIPKTIQLLAPLTVIFCDDSARSDVGPLDGYPAVALPKDDQHRAVCLLRRKNVFARQLFHRCPGSQVPFKPLEFQVAVQRAFGVPLLGLARISP